jgi:hypothetical protein
LAGLAGAKSFVRFGFNSDLKLGDLVLHVQTEDRRPRLPMVDTTVYAGGRVVFRRKTNYEERMKEPGFDDQMVRNMLEEQHRSVLEGLRSGEIPVELFPPPASGPGQPAAPPDGGGPLAAASAPASPAPAAPASPDAGPIRVLLTNPTSWLNAGSARLLIEVRARQPERPIPDAVVEVSFEGAQRPFVFKTITDAEGRAEVGFPLPKFGAGGANMVIRASSIAGRDEIRYHLRPKSTPTGD